MRFSKSVLPEYGGDEEADSDTVDSNHPQHKLDETEHGEFQNESEADRRHCKVWLHSSDLLDKRTGITYHITRSLTKPKTLDRLLPTDASFLKKDSKSLILQIIVIRSQKE